MDASRFRRGKLVGISLAIAISGAASLLLFVRGHVYRGPTREPSGWSGVDKQAVVAEARKLRGVLYDPLQGLFGDLGGRAGFIVCMDVPVIAYRNAGASIRSLLESAYRRHPEHFDPQDGKPGNPFFHRRARNLFAFCRGSGRLSQDGPPQPADVAFFSRGSKGMIAHIALVSEASAGGKVRVTEASRDYWYMTREAELEDVMRRGWVFRGFCDLQSPRER